MTGFPGTPDRDSFKDRAAKLQREYAAKRAKTAGKVFAYYRDKHGEGSVK